MMSEQGVGELGRREGCSGDTCIVFKLVKCCNEEERNNSSSVPKEQWTYLHCNKRDLK